MTSTEKINVRDGNLPDWHALSAEKVLEDLASSTLGLTTDEVARRRLQHGPNRLPAPPRSSRFIQFLNQFNNVLIYVLLCAAVVTALLADWVDAMARTTAVNALIFFQIFYLFNARYFKKSVLSREGLSGNPAVLLAITGITLLQLLFTYVPLFQNIFGTAAIPIGDWIRLIGFTFSVFVLIEIEKMIMRH